MDVSHINSKKGKTKMNLKKLNQEIKSSHRSADYLNVFVDNL